MAWVILTGAGLLEIVWAIALKYADGFTRPWLATLGVVAAMASLALLTVALRSLPVGTAYAVWVGIGALGVAATGIVALGESVSLLRVVFLTVILVGVIGLRLVES